MTRHQQISKSIRRFGKRGIAALPLKRAAIGIDQSEIAARRILKFEQLIRHVRIALLTQNIHQRDGPLPALRVSDFLALEELPFVHAPQRHNLFEELRESSSHLRAGKRLRDQ